MFNLNVGFIGTGGIASAMTRGLCNSKDFYGHIFLSVHKNRTKADKLKEDFPEKISILESNQAVADNCDVLIPSLLPQHVQPALSSLTFKKELRIIHIAAGIKIDEVKKWVSPASIVTRSVPLPFSAQNMGPVVFYGDDEICKKLLELLGFVVSVKEEKDLEILASVTGVMVSYYGLVSEIVAWCMSKGLDFESARDYTCCMNSALSNFMMENCKENTEEFMLENTTPGGTNEMALKIMRETETYKAWSTALEKIGKRYGL